MVKNMINLKKTPDFEDIYDKAKSIDRFLGVLLFKTDTYTRTAKENILLLTLPTNVALLLTFGITTLVRSNFSLLSILMCTSISIVIFTHYFGIGIMIAHKQEIHEFYEWSRKAFKISENYHHVQQKRAIIHLKFLHLWSIRLIKWMRILLYSDAFAITIFISIVGWFLPDHIYPDFLAPLPYILPFKDNETWLAFIITIIMQYKCAVDLCTFSIFLFGMFYIISFCILTYLNIIIDTITMMGKYIQEKYEKKYEEVTPQTPPKRSDLIEIKEEIDAIGFELDGVTLSVTEWVKIIVDMISDVNEIISAFSKVFSTFFLALEFSSFGAIFICGLEVLIVQEQLMYAFGVLTIAMFLFTFCFINEKILEKFTKISNAIYDMPWYYLPPKDRKLLISAILARTIQKGLTAAGLHSLTIERFGKIVQAAYTNIIVLKDLIETH